MANRWRKLEAVTDCIFLSSKITVDGDCNHEIKRCLLLGRKAATNLDSKLKSKDHFANKDLCVVNAMVFPVVMYRCENWTIKKTECWKNDAFNLWCPRRLSGVTGLQADQTFNYKGNQHWIFIGKTDAEAEALILWPPDVKIWLIG